MISPNVHNILNHRTYYSTADLSNKRPCIMIEHRLFFGKKSRTGNRGTEVIIEGSAIFYLQMKNH